MGLDNKHNSQFYTFVQKRNLSQYYNSSLIQVEHFLKQISILRSYSHLRRLWLHPPACTSC